ncbi:transmembrane protein 238 [Protopterus annectens]|uniref:transmembrane protein 238 n=1 Tax=Protopterus annectens TaxID=7888 RepID=UPI001CFB3008|nr:transmembrane protein 238 [Protopterus annectens]
MECAGLGRCKIALSFAIICDLLGLVILMIGIFAKLKLNGQDFGDLLIYSGSILVFISLVGWVFWYTGNIEISLEELQQDYKAKTGTLARLARKISTRFSTAPRKNVNVKERKKLENIYSTHTDLPAGTSTPLQEVTLS